jgi:hypothetical protein
MISDLRRQGYQPSSASWQTTVWHSAGQANDRLVKDPDGVE